MGRLSIFAVLFMIGALTLAGCSGESPEEKARNDGKAFGEAVRAVFEIESIDELRETLQAVDEAQAELLENFGPGERALVMQIVDDVSAVLASLQDAVEAETDEEVRGAAVSALSEVPALVVSLAAITSDDGLLKAAVEGLIDGLRL